MTAGARDPMHLTSRHRDIDALQAYGAPDWVVTLIVTLGLPFDLVHLCADRVLHIEVFDYEEGDAEPLIWREWYWWEALEAPLPAPHAITAAIYAVDRHGTWHVVARQDGRAEEDKA